MARGEPERDKWGSKIEYHLAMIGWAVGYGNVWRFPYYCFKHGGGVFLIPYIISLVIAGVPMYALECTVGQYTSLGPNVAFKEMAPLFRGIGWASLVVSGLVAIYFNMLISWSLWYFFMSFRTDLLWASCENEWNTDFCVSDMMDDKCNERQGLNDSVWYQGQCHNGSQADLIRDIINITQIGEDNPLKSPAEEYFTRGVLQVSENMNEPGHLLWHLVMCQAIAWILVYCCVFQGIKSTGKVVYFTATAPYILITILLIRGCTLPGAGVGIVYYLNPNISKLWSAQIWMDAAVQIFYTYGVAFGVIVSYASYNRFKSNVLTDAYIVCITDSATSFYTGFAIFSTTGFMAHVLNKPVEKVVSAGHGLAFIVFAEAIARMPVAPLWAVLWFFMMVLIGIDSQFPMMEIPVTALMDEFPKLRRYKPILMAAGCVLGFLLGLPLCMNWGIYWFTIINDYSAGYCLIVIAFAEVATCMWIYGFRNFKADVEMMGGVKPTWIWVYWAAVWVVLAPAFMLIIFVMTLINYAPSSVQGQPLPKWAQDIGWAMSAVSIVCIPIFGLWEFAKNRYLGKEDHNNIPLEVSKIHPSDPRMPEKAYYN